MLQNDRTENTVIRPGMGTTATRSVLQSLVRMTRPNRILEIGAGDSTIALAAGMEQGIVDSLEESNALRSEQFAELSTLLVPGRETRYEPLLISVDDHSGQGTSAQEAWNQLERKSLPKERIRFVASDFFSVRAYLEGQGPYGLIWVDAGTPADDVRFFEFAWNNLAPGGIIAFHEPYMSTTVETETGQYLRTVPSPLWLEIRRRSADQDVEVFTLPEWQKYRQAGIGILRKRMPIEASRKHTFDEEMAALGELPVRFDFTRFGTSRTKGEKLAAAIGLLSGDRLTVFGAVAAGMRTKQRILDLTGLSYEQVSRHLRKLIAAKLIGVTGDEFSASLESIENLLPEREPQQSRSVTQREKIEAALSLLRPQRLYSESYINGVCEALDEDFVSLRRKLVDLGYLEREAGTYWLASSA